MSCKISAPTNGEESLLYKTIEGFTASEEEAQELYKYFLSSPDFKQDFGDWQADYKKELFDRSLTKRVDENWEPKLLFDDVVKKYYFIDKHDTKVFYPEGDNKLEDVFSKARIKSITKALALNFFKSRFNENFDEIDLSAKRGTLRDSIVDKLKEKIDEFEASDDIGHQMNAELLQESLLSIDEWVAEVQDYFLRKRLVHKETTETEDLTEEANSERGATYGVSSFEKSSKDNISSNVKLRLSLLMDPTELDETLQEPVFRDFDEVHSSLLGFLTDIPYIEGVDLFNEMLQIIHTLVAKKPYMQTLYSILEQSDDYLQAEFVQAFNLHKNNFIGSIYSSIKIPVLEVQKDGSKELVYKPVNKYSVQNFSSVGAKHNIIKNNWFYNFTKKYVNKTGQISKESKSELQELKKEYDAFFLKFTRNSQKNNYYDALNLPVDKFTEFLNKLGIVTTEDGFNHFLDSLGAGVLNFEQRLGNLTGKKGLASSIKFFIDEITDEKADLDLSQGDNILNKQVAFSRLARAEAFFLNEGSDSSIFTVNKTKWVYSYPSYLSSKIKSWKANRQLLLDQFNTPYNKGSYYMKYLLALDIPSATRLKVSKERLEDFDINIFNSVS